MRLRPLIAAACVVVTALSASVAAPARGGTSSSAPAFTMTKTVLREHLVNNVQQVVDSRTVSLSVSQTTNLRGRQEIQVSWTGAHPTGGIVADPNSIDAQQEEYPFVLLECRGTDSSSVGGTALSPSTCWTQSWSERYQDTFQTAFPAYRLDQFASTADRTQTAGAPASLPAACKYLPAPIQHWIPFVAANATTYDGGPAGCAGQPPEASNVGNGALPSNETFGVTGLDGSGSANFDVWTASENASLGCSTTVPCSLVAVPIMGISCDSSGSLASPGDQPSPAQEPAAAAGCEAGGNFAPGQLVTPQGGDSLAVSGSLWWSASNWRNRISVPLGFAVPASACSVVGNSNALDIYGSELMTQATEQWAPHFCLDSTLFPFVHVQTGEPEARNLVAAGTADAALTSDPQASGYGRPVINAPVAMTGFAISYVIDGADGRPYTSLRLTPRLLAKLLTESYPADLFMKQEDPDLAKNPLNITLDPEFIALNPGVKQGVAASEAASELLSLSSNSDVVHALTSYINADPAARKWLDGTPDQWGMVVNPAYKGISLPVDQWPLLSTFEPGNFYGSDNNDCLFRDPVPYLPLVAAPVQTLAASSQDLQFGIANPTTVCSQIDGTTLGEKLVPLGRETVGYRFLIGVTPLADTHRFLLDTAALQSTPGSFVSPDDGSLTAAAKLLSFDSSSGTWPIPYGQIVGSSAGSAAYPGTMLVYAAVPTRGLSGTSAAELATLLRFAASSGQTPGTEVGQLPPGYLPMTAANGLGAQADYTTQAALDVAAQNGQLPGQSAVSGSATSPFDAASWANVLGNSSSVGSIANSSMIPLLLSLEGHTVGFHLGSTAGIIVGLLALILLLGPVALAALVAGRRRGRW